MQIGAINGYIDVAQLELYAFWLFFAGLLIYLRREDKREGYPLQSDRSAHITVQGFPPIPAPKSFHLADGRTQTAPRAEGPQPPAYAAPTAAWPGAPFQPVGNPMLSGVGPAAFAYRANEPELLLEGGKPRIAPLRVATDYSIAEEDPDPRGMTVLGADGEPAGVVRDAWIDRAEIMLRYLEVEIVAGARVLLPMALARIAGGRVRVASVLARHFADAPRHGRPDQVTMREEDAIGAYFASGHLYATPERAEPLL